MARPKNETTIKWAGQNLVPALWLLQISIGQQASQRPSQAYFKLLHMLFYIFLMNKKGISTCYPEKINHKGGGGGL